MFNVTTDNLHIYIFSIIGIIIICFILQFYFKSTVDHEINSAKKTFKHDIKKIQQQQHKIISELKMFEADIKNKLQEEYAKYEQQYDEDNYNGNINDNDSYNDPVGIH